MVYGDISLFYQGFGILFNRYSEGSLYPDSSLLGRLAIAGTKWERLGEGASLGKRLT
ncbi:MAG: hypothetical protein ACHQYP_09015 [Nitrospiria bacterium]